MFKRLGNQRLGRFIDIAEFLLQGVQDRQERTVAIEAVPNALKRDLFIPGNLSCFQGHRGYCSSSAARPRSFDLNYVFYSNNKRLSHQIE